MARKATAAATEPAKKFGDIEAKHLRAQLFISKNAFDLLPHTACAGFCLGDQVVVAFTSRDLFQHAETLGVETG